MFETKGRLIATLLVVGFLVASLGMLADYFAQDASADSWECTFMKGWCCGVLRKIEKHCTRGSDDYNPYWCDYYMNLAGPVCAGAAEECGYPTYHLCYN